MEFKEEHRGCPVIDPLEEIKYKCDAIHSKNIVILNHLVQVIDKLLLIEKRFDEMERNRIAGVP